MAYLAMLGACTGTDPTTEGPPEVAPPPDLPVLELSQPERGSFSEGPVTVRGRATAGTGALAGLEVNDEAVSMAGDGAFEVTLSPPPGLLLLGTRVVDDIGERAVDGRAVQVGPTRPHGAVVPNAISVWLGPQMLDDDAPDLDDLAAVSEVVLTDPAFGDRLAGTTTSAGSIEVTITSLLVDDADVDIVPLDGLLQLDTRLYAVEATFDAEGMIIDTTGRMEIEEIELLMDLAISTDGSGVHVEPVWVEATVDGLWWEADGVPSWAESLLTDTLAATIEASLEEKAVELVGGLVGDTLSSFALDTTLGSNDEVEVSLTLAEARVTEDGVLLAMDGTVSASRAAFALPPGAGSLATRGEGPALPLPGLGARPFQTVVDDDFLNQVLFAFWYGGMLSGWELSGLELAAMSGGPMAPPLGPVARAKMGVQLPPIFAPPSGETDLDLSLGELWIDIEREDGEKVSVSLNVRAGAYLEVGEAGFGFAIDDRPSLMTVHAGMREWPAALDPGDLASLFRLATPSLMGRSSSLFPSFPAPEIPLDAFIEVPSLAGKTWALADVEASVEPSGFLVMRGKMSAD